MVFNADIMGGQLELMRPKLEAWRREPLGVAGGGNGLHKWGQPIKIVTMKAVCNKLGDWFPEFGIIFDGIPSFAEVGICYYASLFIIRINFMFIV